MTEDTLMQSAPSLSRSRETLPVGTHHVCFHDLEDLRRQVGTRDVLARRKKSEVFYAGIEARQRLPQGIHDRCEEFVYAAGGLPSRRDLDGLARHMPVHYKIIRLHSHRVAAGEVWDLTVRGEAYWPELDHLEELYVFLHVDHLVLEQGARVVVRGNVMAVECGTLERASCELHPEPVSADCFDIGILPTPDSVDRNASLNTGARGADGRPGARGADGASVRVEGSIFGPWLSARDGETCVETDGQDGGHGGTGQHGRQGRNGGMCRLADIRIGRLIGFTDNPLRVFSQAGRGGPGGDGGDGGNGGDGGHGGVGAAAVNGHVPFGNGGTGGDGGQGGDGGNGGNGGISSNVFLQLRPDDCAHVQVLSLPSTGGVPGRGGAGGIAGAGGTGGVSPVTSSGGNDGAAGRDGANGVAGRSGKGRPGARIFIVSATGEVR